MINNTEEFMCGKRVRFDTFNTRKFYIRTYKDGASWIMGSNYRYVHDNLYIRVAYWELSIRFNTRLMTMDEFALFKKGVVCKGCGQSRLTKEEQEEHKECLVTIDDYVNWHHKMKTTYPKECNQSNSFPF